MHHPASRVIVATYPDWYFRSKSLDWWLSSLFDMMVEVHAFQLGLLLGLVFGVLAVTLSPKVSAVVLVIPVAFLFGAFDIPVLCGTRTSACAHVRLKPWYFLFGLLCSEFAVLAIKKVIAVRIPARTGLSE